MLRRVLAAAFCLALPTLAWGQASSYAPPPAIVSTNSVLTCGPVTGTLSAAGQVVQAPAACAGFGTYVITVTTASGDSAFAGTLFSYDATTGGPRRLHKTGVGALQVPTDVLTGTQTGTLEYRTCGGAGPQAVSATAYTSGRATITITGVLSPTACFINGSVQTAEEAALRAGKAFTASTGLQTVTAGQYEALTLSNPSGSGVRLVIPGNNRIVACSNPSNAALPAFQSIPNAATNVPTTATAITRRGGTTGTSAAAVTYVASTASKPDTSPTTANPVGLPFFGSYAVPQDRTLEPGNTLTIIIAAVGTGLTGAANPTCSIIASWFEESLN